METAGFAELTKRLNQASAAVDDLQRKERFARDRVVMAQQMLSHVAYQAKERGKQEDKLQQIRASLGVYRELQVAFGKKGVQALLIESAIPEIEEEANRLLSRMTDGRMNLRFETSAKQSGDGTMRRGHPHCDEWAPAIIDVLRARRSITLHSHCHQQILSAGRASCKR